MGNRWRWSRRTVLPVALVLSAGLVTATMTIGVPVATGATATPAQVVGAAQSIDGFGASGAWWPNDLTHFSSTVQKQVADLLFTNSGIELSQYRYNIGGGGVGVTNGRTAAQTFLNADGTYDWTKDPGGTTFLKDAAVDGVPDLIGFVNSAPTAFTTNHQNCGGSIDTTQDAAYAKYLATVASHFVSQSVTLNQISPMNEPDSNFSGCGQEGMKVPAADRAGVIDAVGSALHDAGLNTTIIADESSMTSLLLSEAPTWLADPTAPSYVSTIAHHVYDFPSNSQLEKVAALGALNNKPLWNTEICCQTKLTGSFGSQYDPTITGGLSMANTIYTDMAYGGDSAFQWWTALSPKMGTCDPTTSTTCASTVGTSGSNDGLIYYDKNYSTNGDQNLYIAKRFYVLGQYSKYVRPGARRYAVTGTPSGVQVLAFWQNNAWTVVAANDNTTSTSLALNLGSGTLTPSGTYRTSATENMAGIAAPGISGSTITQSLPAESVTTFVLDSSGKPGSAGYTARELIGAQSGRCLDVPRASTTNGTQLEIYTCNAGSNQEYTLTTGGTITVYSGTYQRCLEGRGQSTTAGTAVDINTCTGASSQQWIAHPDGSITNAASGLCLDVISQGTANGALIDEYTCNGGANQQWNLS